MHWECENRGRSGNVGATVGGTIGTRCIVLMKNSLNWVLFHENFPSAALEGYNNIQNLIVTLSALKFNSNVISIKKISN